MFWPLPIMSRAPRSTHAGHCQSCNLWSARHGGQLLVSKTAKSSSLCSIAVFANNIIIELLVSLVSRVKKAPKVDKSRPLFLKRNTQKIMITSHCFELFLTHILHQGHIYPLYKWTKRPTVHWSDSQRTHDLIILHHSQATWPLASPYLNLCM